MTNVQAGTVLSTILRHDHKVTSYKIALLRSINDVVLAFPDILVNKGTVAVPLRLLAERWVAYYWPFVDPSTPVLQGRRSERNGRRIEDLSFRPQLTALRQAWEHAINEAGRPSDGFYLINEFRIPRRRDALPPLLYGLYGDALKAIKDALQQPIRYAGPGEWSVFERPKRYRDVVGDAVAVPGTRAVDQCLLIPCELWFTFQAMSLWVEALCLHEWALFSESVQSGSDRVVDRGTVYQLLTDRPDNRRPLTWERNHVDLLIMEGKSFTCPWTGRSIDSPGDYALDHLIPIGVYPINELWNLVPADAHFNAHIKRDRLPDSSRLIRAIPGFELAYSHYRTSPVLAATLSQDVSARFFVVPSGPDYAQTLAAAVAQFITRITLARNLPRFS